MSRVAWLFTHLTIRGAWSWPTLTVVYALNIAISTVAAFGATASWWQRLIAVTVAVTALFVVIGVGVLVERSMSPTWRRGAAALVTFALAGATRGAVVSSLFIAWGVDSGPAEWARVLGGVALGLAVLTPMSLLVGEAREFAAARARLLARREQLAAAVEQVTTQIGDRDEAVLERIRGALVQAMDAQGDQGPAGEPSAASAARLDALAVEVIRPMSHELARAVPSIELPGTRLATPRISWRSIADAACHGRPFLPVGTALLIALLSAPSLGVIFGAWWTIAYVVIGVPLVATLLAAVNGILCRVLPGRGLNLRIALVIAAAVIAGLAAGALADVVYRASSSATLVSDASSPLIPGAFLVPMLALPLAGARGTFIVHQRTLNELGVVDVVLSRRLARLRQVQWSRQRVLARALHGPVQTLVVAGAKRLRDVEGGTRVAQAQLLQAQLLTLLAGSEGVDDRVSWTEGLNRIEATWAGVAHIEVTVTPKALARLGADRVTADVMIEILGEGVANAVRHGDATRIDAHVVAEGEDLCFTVTDDGCRGLRSETGMGSQLLTDCCLSWERAEIDDGVRLTGCLPGPSSTQ